MEIGWAIDKGLDVLKVSWQVYRAFNDPDANAPRQFRELSKEFSTFHIVFEKLLKVLEEHNRPLIVPLTSIEYTLEKCRRFQEKFGVLSEVNTKRTIKQGLTIGFRTIQWSFLAEKVANDLRAELSSHSRILSLYTDTLNLQNAFEERVENYEIREQNREILRLLQAGKEPEESAERASVVFPEVPHHQPVQINLPDVPQHQPQRTTAPGTQLANLNAAHRDLEALERFLDTEGRILADVPVPIRNDGPRNPAHFIDLARHEIELQLQRVDNFSKRLQNMPHHQDDVNVQATATATSTQLPQLTRSDSEHSRLLSSRRESSRRSISTTTTNAASRPRSPIIQGTTTGLQISLPIEQASLGSPVQIRRDSMIRRSASLPDDASTTLRQYLARFDAELDELDQYDVDGQIAKMRMELFDQVQRSFPPSPDLSLSPTSTSCSARVSPSIIGMLSSSPSSINPTLAPLRRDTLTTITSRRSSMGGNQWQFLAKNVEIDGFQYTCAKCATIEVTALQVHRRSSGGLSFALLCMGSQHRLADGLLFRHDLSSSVPAYPHIFHRGANPQSGTHVRVLGQPSRLEGYNAGRSVLYKILPSQGVCYKFASLEDSEFFQQIIYQARLLKQFDVKSITSSAYSGHPPRYIAVRLWESVPLGSISIMFHTLLIDKCESVSYVQHANSFTTPSTSGTKVKLKLTDNSRPMSMRHGRTNSRDSGMSGISTGSDDASISGTPTSNTMAKIKWIEIDFQDRPQREAFLELWNKQ